MSLTYSISVDDTYDTEAVDLVLLEQQIKSAIESELGFRVDLSIVRATFPTANATKKDEEKKSEKTTTTRDTALLVLGHQDYREVPQQQPQYAAQQQPQYAVQPPYAVQPQPQAQYSGRGMDASEPLQNYNSSTLPRQVPRQSSAPRVPALFGNQRARYPLSQAKYV
eukprot:3266016-Rhodomonas_salina.6